MENKLVALLVASAAFVALSFGLTAGWALATEYGSEPGRWEPVFCTYGEDGDPVDCETRERIGDYRPVNAGWGEWYR